MFFQKATGICLATFLATFVALETDAQEREWTSANGKFNVTGMLLDQQDGSVKIKRSDNGKTITVPVEKLSDADQTYLSELKSKQMEQADTKEIPTGKPDLKVAGRTQWSKFPSFTDGKEDPLDLELFVEAMGDQARDAIFFGMLKFDKIEADGKAIEVARDRFSFADPSKEFVLVERSDNDFFNKHPKNGVRVKLTFSHPKTKLKEFTSVKGEFKIRTGGKRDVIKVPATAGQDIKNAQLKKLGIKTDIELDDSLVNINFTGDLSAVYDIKLLDAKGKEPDSLSGTSWSGSEEAKSYSFSFDDENSIPKNLVFEISIVTDLEELTVPFDLSGIAVAREN